MSIRRALMAAALVAGVAACSPKPEAHDGASPEEAKPATAQVEATVIGVDAKNGTVTLQHGPIAAWGWPAMRMAFTAPTETVATAKVGQRVTADLKMVGSTPQITALH
jgi:Cu(I)/Ag(I) efflux system protein CusF